MTNVLNEKLELQGLKLEEPTVMEEVKEEIQVNQEQEVKEETKIDNSELIRDLEEHAEQMSKDIEQIETLKTELLEINKQMSEEFEKLSSGLDRDEIYNQYKSLVDKYEGKPEYRNDIREIKKFLQELDDCSTFNPIKKSISKIKNPSKITSNLQMSYENNLKKFSKKSKENRSYIFINLDSMNMLEQLSKYLPEADSKLFLTLFLGYAANQNSLNTYPVLINEVLRQIKRIDTIQEKDREKMLENIKQCIELVK